MKTIVCSLFNSSEHHFSPPLIFQDKQQAVNTFINEVQAPDSELVNIKDRLSIFAIGEFDHKTGKIKSFWSKKLLLMGSEISVPQLPTSEKENL